MEIKNILIKSNKSLYFFYKEIRNKFFALLFTYIVIGVLDGIGLTMFLPLLQLTDTNGNVKPNEFGSLGNAFLFIEDIGVTINFKSILLLLVFFFILKGLVVYLGNVYKVSVQQYFVKRIRTRLIKSLSEIKFISFMKSDIGKIQNTLSGEVARLSMSLSNYLGAFQNIILVVVYLSFSAMINPGFTLLVILGGGLTHILFRRIYHFTKIASRDLTNEGHVYQGLLIQFVSNFKYLKATATVNKIKTKLISQIEKIEKNNRKIGVLNSIMTAVREPSMMMVVAGAIFIQTQFFGTALSAIMVSLLFFYRALASLMAVQTFWNAFLTVSGSLENMQSFQSELGQNKEVLGKGNFSRLQNGIKLSEVSVAIENNIIIEKINLWIPAKKTMAFVGQSGSGKTTLINTISGLLRPNDGKIIIDEINSNDLNLNTYCERIGYITQEPVIFNATIFDNITLWSNKSEEVLLKFKRVLEQASLNEFINSIPEGYDTVLGNNGINLSGGQKQRISIARELFKDIDLLIMDEATSALDSETELAIQQNIEKLKGSYTILIIAHRLSTIKNADLIVVLDKGKISEIDTYQNLLVKSPNFKRMTELQELN